jgi:hypothetical protein
LGAAVAAVATRNAVKDNIAGTNPPDQGISWCPVASASRCGAWPVDADVQAVGDLQPLALVRVILPHVEVSGGLATIFPPEIARERDTRRTRPGYPGARKYQENGRNEGAPVTERANTDSTSPSSASRRKRVPDPSNGYGSALRRAAGGDDHLSIANLEDGVRTPGDGHDLPTAQRTEKLDGVGRRRSRGSDYRCW